MKTTSGIDSMINWFKEGLKTGDIVLNNNMNPEDYLASVIDDEALLKHALQSFREEKPEIVETKVIETKKEIEEEIPEVQPSKVIEAKKMPRLVKRKL